MDGARAVRRAPFGDNPVVGERGTDTQRRILAAALEVFADVGFHGARVELITGHAGCSRPTFYQYFSSKDDVFWTLAGNLGEAMVRQAEGLEAVTPDARGVHVLRGWLSDFADLYGRYAPVFSAFPAAARDHEAMAAGSRSIGDRLGQALIAGAGLDLREVELESLASAIVTMVVRANFYLRRGSGAIPLARFVDGLAQTIHRLLVGAIEGVNVAAHAPPDRATRVPSSQPASAARTKVTETSSPQTRTRLLDAGAVVLPARGYHQTRVDDIVEEAGVSHGSFYRYFANKDDLFAVLADQAAHVLRDLIDELPAPADRDELRRWLQKWFAAYREHGGIISAWQEIELSDPRLHDVSQATANAVFQRLVAVLDSRAFGDAEVDALALFALLERMPYSVLSQGHTDEEEAIGAMVVIIDRGLLGR